MWFANKRLDEAFEFINDSDFDFFCLQEVPQHFLKRLQTLPCHLAYAVDVRRFSPREEDVYLVTLSRHQIVNKGEIPFPDYWDALPWRTRLFVWLMYPFNWTRITNRNCFYIEATVDGVLMHVFNLHLILGNPQWRLEEFETAMLARDQNRPSIVCGDFNVLESPRVSILNWIVAGRISDVIFWNRERAAIEERFSSHNLSNALRGKQTHPFSASQLDHVLVSPHFTVSEVQVIDERYGSDHHPIFIEVAR